MKVLHYEKHHGAVRPSLRNAEFGFCSTTQRDSPFKFVLDIPPRPHPAFSMYVLQITPKSGLSWIKAIGHDINSSAYGFELRGAFTAMEEKLKKSYGSSVLTDILMPDSIWNEPKDWMTSLLKKERLLSCVWNNDSGATLTDAIQSIHLIATASESDTGYISVEYALTSCAQSDAEINDLQDDVL